MSKENLEELTLNTKEELFLFEEIAKSLVKQSILKVLLKKSKLNYEELWNSAIGKKIEISSSNSELVKYGLLESRFVIIEGEANKKRAGREYTINTDKKECIEKILKIIEQNDTYKHKFTAESCC